MLPLSPAAHFVWALAALALAPAALLLTCSRGKKKAVEAVSPGPGGSIVSPNGTPTGGSARTITGSNSATSVRVHYNPQPVPAEPKPPLGYREGFINRILEDKYYTKKREPSVSSLQFERSSRPRRKALKEPLKDGCYRNTRGETVRAANDDETLNMVDSGCFGAQQAVVSKEPTKEIPDGKSAPASVAQSTPSVKKDSTRKEEQKESIRSEKKKKSRDGRKKKSEDSRKKGRKRRSRHRSDTTTETTEESEEEESEPTRRRRKRSDRKRRKDSPVERKADDRKKKEKVKNEKKEEPQSPIQPEPGPDPEQHKTAPTQKTECD